MRKLVFLEMALLIIATGIVPVGAAPGFSCAAVTEIPQIECEALVAIFNSTNGPGWVTSSGWLESNTPSSWYGVNVWSGHVHGLVLDAHGLRGSIPPEIGHLSYLAYMNLGFNDLGGSIPPEIGNLTLLHDLMLYGDHLTGSIPPEMGNLSSMKLLFLSDNQLSGTIPIQLANLTQLTALGLSGNQLSGGIPAELGNLPYLNYLYFYNNKLSGSLPEELSNLINLIELDLGSNQLNGSIPPEYGNLTNLQMLALRDNHLSGDIPSTFINLVNLANAGQGYNGADGLNLDYNLLNVPPGYPEPADPLQVFLHQKDPDWQLYQPFQQVIGTGGGEITSGDGTTDIHIPAGALDSNTTFTFIPQGTPNHFSGILPYAYNSFQLTGLDSGGNPVAAFNLPVIVTVTYPWWIPENRLALYYWDESAAAWADAVTTCPGGEYTRDLDANILTLPLCHLTEFALFSTPLPTFIPIISH
ncbi:MAG: hypothetical protein C3F13_17955 [Anaerolineales bacterium]|nr:MAG: hypothetical protein C3F13_17955 [Anaerolineales bacterium]